ncbi:MAG: hypothetical protein ACFHVJ_18850 [Aestuariibacter sp.]
MSQHPSSDTIDSDSVTLFAELVSPVYKKLRGLQHQFERLTIDEVEQHVEMLREITLTEHSVWVAIALATVDINPSLKDQVEQHKPCSVTSAVKSWIEYCLEHNLVPLMDEDGMSPIRFLQR